jgi:predicted nucleic acid-binding protein
MIKVAFLDTNILMDLVFDRQPFNDEAEQIFELKHSHQVELNISALTVANVAYFLKKAKKDQASFIKNLFYWTQITELNKTVIEKTLASGFLDFEDGLQYHCARTVKSIEVIVTRNAKDFKLSMIPVVSPTEFLKSFDL